MTQSDSCNYIYAYEQLPDMLQSNAKIKFPVLSKWKFWCVMMMKPGWSMKWSLHSALFVIPAWSTYSSEGEHAVLFRDLLRDMMTMLCVSKHQNPSVRAFLESCKIVTCWQISLICSGWVGADPADEWNWWMVFFPFLFPCSRKCWKWCVIRLSVDPWG